MATQQHPLYRHDVDAAVDTVGGSPATAASQHEHAAAAGNSRAITAPSSCAADATGAGDDCCRGHSGTVQESANDLNCKQHYLGDRHERHTQALGSQQALHVADKERLAAEIKQLQRASKAMQMTVVKKSTRS